MELFEYCQAEVQKALEETSKSFDELILEKLEPYGITKDNIKEYIDNGELLVKNASFYADLEKFDFYFHDKFIFSLYKHVELVERCGTYATRIYYEFVDTKKDDVDGY